MDVNVLRKACAAVQAAHETREATANFSTDAMACIAAVEVRMPGARSFVALDIWEFAPKKYPDIS